MLLYGLLPQSFSVENHLRLMLRNRVVEFIFQSPYSPEFNSWEFRFRSMKAYLRLHKQFSKNLHTCQQYIVDLSFKNYSNFCTASQINPTQCRIIMLYIYILKNRDQGCFEWVQIPDSAWECKQLAASWNLNLQLPWSKRPIKHPTLHHKLNCKVACKWTTSFTVM